MKLSPLTAISPVDGRYSNKTAGLAPYCSEYALFKYRTIVEVRWFEKLADAEAIEEVPQLSETAKRHLQAIIDNFDNHAAEAIKNIEKTTNHDVKAVEYYLKEQFCQLDELAPLAEYIHFACTSEDINNLAYGLMVKEAREKILSPAMTELVNEIKQVALATRDVAMIARTHGQTASPTTMGKEMTNFTYRLQRQINRFNAVELFGKINGAVGNFNAHFCAYPDIDWLQLSQSFVESLGLSWNAYTTQIENHDYLAEYFTAITAFNTILIDFNRDIWGYISLGYFKQKTVQGEVGSSTMPHKVNPIDFENSEGNLGMSNAIMGYLSQQLPCSRWQRDLVDSTLLRNIGPALAHSIISYQSTLKGVKKLQINQSVIDGDLGSNWEVLGEAIQTVMRKHGIEKPYEKLKELTRGKSVNAAILQEFVEGLELPVSVKEQLKQLTPSSYIGLAQKLQDAYEN